MATGPEDATMTTMLSLSDRSVDAGNDQCVVLDDIGWKGYSTMLKLRAERPGPRLVYLDGSLWLVSPSFLHEFLKKRLGQFVMVVVEELDIPCVPSGSTTLRLQKKRGGVEGDESFYLANVAATQGKTKLDMRVDPPPDLAVEAVYSHAAEAALEVYRRFGVPEVWVCDESELQILVRQANGDYARSETSAAFPYLKASEIAGWVNRPRTASETEWIKALRRWVVEELVARRGAIAEE
jgi:Uma2 family endonuclease